MKKIHHRRVTAIVVCTIFLLILSFTILALQFAYDTANKITCWSPDYEKIDLTEILNKSELSDEDYQTLYAQTGLTKIGIDRCLAKGPAGKVRIHNIQEDYFAEHTVLTDHFSYLTCTDRLTNKEHITNVYLENGDILVTSSTHISGWRMGHSGLVTNASTSSVLQASNYEVPSALGTVADFTSRVTFMVLSPKVDTETKNEVASYAEKNLVGINYSAVIGILRKKDSIDRTQCAHAVWYAYHHFGYDIDGNGGGLVVPQDFTKSDLLEVVQVFGFNPTTLKW
jgi:hypothetical protein